jgi:hypothetical protein
MTRAVDPVSADPAAEAKQPAMDDDPALAGLLQTIAPAVDAMVGAVREYEWNTGGIGDVPLIGHTMNLRIERFLFEFGGFHTANCVLAAAAAPLMLPAAMVEDHAARFALNTFPRDVAS